MRKSMNIIMAAAVAMAITGCASGKPAENAANQNAATEAAADAKAGTGAEAAGADNSAAGTDAKAGTDAEAAGADNSAADTTDGASYTIGIGQFAEHGSLDNCREGFLQGLAEEGIVEGENLTVLYENSQADGGTASQIIDNFLAKDTDLICAIATPMAQSAYSAAKKEDVPVIYTAVTDPVLAELANADGTPVGEITGTSDKLPVEKQLEMIRTLLPDAKKIGIMYSTSEINSVSAIEEYKAAAPNYGFEIVESGISATADIPLAADSLLEKVDCINNLTDNTVVSSLPLILDKAAKKGIPVFGSEIEQVRIGCLATVGLDYVSLGAQTGKMAAQVLKGEKKASEMSFEIIDEAAFYGNNKVAADLGITIPESLSSTAAEMFDEIVTE
ncbi:MAG: ABC transporter substrate-binding protein [Eubacteriales bacterium]|nr:ABC transporter substrate-binding protein [Eubacteriales bacterium]